MARRRSPLDPKATTNEGTRLLRELLTRTTFGAIARRLRCDEGTVRHYAREKHKPEGEMRGRMFDVLGIPFDSWDQPPSSDVYAVDPATTRRT